MALLRSEIASEIAVKLENNKEKLRQNFNEHKTGVRYFYIDNLLPIDWCNQINNAFPKTSEMSLKKSLREDKYIGVQMDKYKALIADVIYAFQEKRVVEVIKEICDIEECSADASLYAGGISSMVKKQFLKPHLDNSHDQNRNKWRVLNLLYYTTPEWKKEYGGNLEVWTKGLKGNPTTIVSTFNRLVVMGTDKASWHSVSPIGVDKRRNCVSNYYFSNTPLNKEDTFHVTLFRAWPKQKLENVILRFDGFARMLIRKVFPKGVVKNPHVYNKNPSKKTQSNFKC